MLQRDHPLKPGICDLSLQTPALAESTFTTLANVRQPATEIGAGQESSADGPLRVCTSITLFSNPNYL